MIAIATLLVAVVGATFAYFTATANDTTNEQAAEVTTAKVSNVNLTMTPESPSNFEPVYPGIMLATGVKLEATWQDSANAPTEPWEISYRLNAEIDLSEFKTSNTQSEFTYSIYRSTSEVTNPVTSCQKHEEATSSETKMYVDSCSITNLQDDGVEAVSTDNSIEFNDTNNGIITYSGTEKLEVGKSYHYYLVLNYKNKEEENQATTDVNKKISIKFTGTTDTTLSKKSA